MYWPDTGTGVDTEPARKPVASAVRKYFTEGGAGVPPTVPGGDWFNAITNEVLNVLAAAGIDPSKTDDDQLLQAILIVSKAMSARESLRRTYEEAGWNLLSEPQSFANGGVLTGPNDVLLDEMSGRAYSGAGPYPQEVGQGTSPVSGGFIDRSSSSENATYSTVEEVATGKFPIGKFLTLTDRSMGTFKVVSGGVADGFGILNAGVGKTAQYVNVGLINVEHFGAKADCWLADGTTVNPTPTDNYPIFTAAMAYQGAINIPFRVGGYMYCQKLIFEDRVVYGNGATLVPHNFSDEHSAVFHNIKLNDLKIKPRDWGVNSFNGRPYLVTFPSVLDRCDFTAFQKSQLFYDDITITPKVHPYYTEHRECRFRYFKEHNIVVKQGANLIKFYGGITGWAGSPAYMEPPTIQGAYDGILVTRDSSPTPIGPYTPESLVILGMDASYNSRYGFNLDKLSFADISTGYTELNLLKSMRLGDIVGTQILANKVSDSYDDDLPLIDWGNNDGVQRYHNHIVINGQNIGSGASIEAGSRRLCFDLAYAQQVLIKQGCYPIITGTPEGYVHLTSVFPITYSELLLDDNFNIKSLRKGHDIQTRTHFFQSSLPSPEGYQRTLGYLNSTGELYFCNPVSGWKKITLT